MTDVTPVQTIQETINWTEIDQKITDKTAKLSILAKELGFSSEDFRKLLVAHYGDRILFKRGRTGGIYFKETA